MKKRTMSLLAILLLISLVACSNNIGDTESTPSDAAQQPTQTTEPSTEPTTEPVQEPSTSQTEEPGEQVPINEEPTPEATQEPTTTPPATTDPLLLFIHIVIATV